MHTILLNKYFLDTKTIVIRFNCIYWYTLKLVTNNQKLAFKHKLRYSVYLFKNNFISNQNYSLQVHTLENTKIEH